MRRFVPILLFIPGYTLGSIVTSVIAAFGLEWYDPKWGSPYGAVEMDLSFLPLFLLVALVGHGLAITALFDRFLRLRPAAAGQREFAVGFTAPVVEALAAYITQRGAPGTAVAAAIETVGLGTFLIVPIVLTVAIYLLPGRNKSGVGAPVI